MQTPLANQRSKNNPRMQGNTIILTALLLFALSGLVSGFAFGAFVHSKPQTTPNPGVSNGNTPVVQQNGTATATPTAKPTKLGWPVVDQSKTSLAFHHTVYAEIANNTESYTLAAYAVDQSIDSGHGKRVYAADITCKIWLMQRVPDNAKVQLSSDTLKNIAALQNPITADIRLRNGTADLGPNSELPNLTFASSTPQKQTCTNGEGIWNYTVSPSTPDGDYTLIILMDWQGQYANWYWLSITVTH